MKKFLAVLLMVCILAAGAVPCFAKELMTGDVDADGSVSVKDATAVQRYLADMHQLPKGQFV